MHALASNAKHLCPGVVDEKNLCPKFVDVKAFKGKGAAWSMLTSIRGAFEDCWSEMFCVALETAHMRTRAYLQVHRYPGLPRIPAAHSLRWRVKGGGRDAHTVWDGVEDLIKDESAPVKRYYWNLNQRMLELNCLAQMLQQSAIRLLLRLSDRSGRTAPTKETPDGAVLFHAWVRGEITLADFDMREDPYRSLDHVE